MRTPGICPAGAAGNYTWQRSPFSWWDSAPGPGPSGPPSCADNTGRARHAACFYGAAIRNLTGLAPRVPVDLIFPDHEPGFDVLALTDRLKAKPLVRGHVVPERHGFMNPLSAGYSEPAARHWTDWLKRLILSSDGDQTAE